MDANHSASEGSIESEECGRECLYYLRQYTHYYQSFTRNMLIKGTFGEGSEGNKKHAIIGN